MKARAFAQPKADEIGRRFIGTIPISRSVYEAVFGQLWRNIVGVKNDEKRAVEFAKKAAYVLFEPEEIVGHNVGRLNGQGVLCHTKMRCVSAELDKFLHETMLAMVPSTCPGAAACDRHGRQPVSAVNTQ